MPDNMLPTAPWIKICGLTDPDTALECARLEADAIGLVFFKKSPRNVSMEQAALISKALPDHILPIGVFVDASYDAIMEKVKSCHLKGVQLHGNESPKLVEQLVKKKLMVIKALFSKKAPFIDQATEYSRASFILVEYGKGILPGGNAESWDYKQCRNLNTGIPVILAGGLNAKNVCLAVKDVCPAAVDVSSGVEKSPGIKDLKKIAAFILQVKQQVKI
ncbi:MAG: phosphoribosylanthranilate isomerase [Desulfobacula sp.]|nr:phosphoribosylanthranilate isomerase [Desulfobacula sp.]